MSDRNLFAVVVSDAEPGDVSAQSNMSAISSNNLKASKFLNRGVSSVASDAFAGLQRQGSWLVVSFRKAVLVRIKDT